ncbi:MAG: hypothetical protein ACRCYY_20790 [Trueperaceae bacterium]
MKIDKAIFLYGLYSKSVKGDCFAALATVRRVNDEHTPSPGSQ